MNFIQHLYDGDEVSEAADKGGYATTTGYNWVHAWNDEGVEGLVANFGGGRSRIVSIDFVDNSYH